MKTISQCKKENRMPEHGTPCKTIINPKHLTEAFFVAPKNIKTRCNGVGNFIGWVPGGGGDLWWIKHSDDSVGAYCYDEVFDVDFDERPMIEKRLREEALTSLKKYVEYCDDHHSKGSN